MGIVGMTPQEFEAARKQLGLSETALARLFKVGDRTVRRWEDGEKDIPGPAQVLISLLVKSPEARRLAGIE